MDKTCLRILFTILTLMLLAASFIGCSREDDVDDGDRTQSGSNGLGTGSGSTDSGRVSASEFFNGQRTAQDAARIIQSRASRYIAELG